MVPPGRTVRWRHYVLLALSVRMSVRLSVRPSVRLLPKLSTRYFENERTDFDANWRKWSTGQDMKWSVWRPRGEVKGQGHTRPKIDFEVRRSVGSIILDPIESIRFCSFFFVYWSNVKASNTTRSQWITAKVRESWTTSLTNCHCRK